MKKVNYNFKKKFGQNFLIDNNVINNIIGSIQIEDESLIIEIGPGSGNLTKELQKTGAKIIAYEIDLETKEYLDKLENEKTKIIYEDFLNRDIKQDVNEMEYQELHVIANLPYYITTPIIEKIIKSNINPKTMILMVQKEVADRLSAKPKTKDYGFITVYLNYYFNIKKLFNVSKTAFKPIPKVDSAVLKFEKQNEYKINDEEKFISLIKDAFKHKRKNLNNNLTAYNKELIESILLKYDLSLKSRAEEVPIEVFIEITNAL